MNPRDRGRTAKPYHITAMTRLVNAAFRAATHCGLGDHCRHVMTVRGRHSGRDRSVPLDVMTVGAHRYLVAAYGVVGWVHNVRAAGEVSLTRAGRTIPYRADEIRGPEAVPVIRQYIRAVPVTRRYWEVRADSSDEEVLAVLDRHPVFLLTPIAQQPDRQVERTLPPA